MTVAPTPTVAEQSVGSGLHMEVRRHEGDVASVVDALNRQRVWFGAGPFSGLVTPSSVVLSPETIDLVRLGLQAVWEWFRGWQTLYRDLVSVEAGHPVVRHCEWGLTPEQVRAQRHTAAVGSLPHIVRLDTVTAVPSLQIAEAQWKGGGEGFLAGIDAVCRRFFPVTDEAPVDALVDMWAAYYADLAGDGHVVSVVRADWVDADRAFAGVLAERGRRVTVATPADLAARLSVRDGTVLYATDDGSVDVAALRCDRLPDVLTGQLLDDVVACAHAGSLVLDPAPSYLCTQKFGMALPFTADFGSYFSDDVRRCLIPTVLVADPPECGPLAAALADHGGEQLTTMATWDDLIRMPRSLRRRLVVKCGSANPVWNQGGRGVWKLGGPTNADSRVLNTVLTRVRSGREAWIVQPYVDQTWPVDLYHPDEPDRLHTCDAHTRLLFYGCRQGDAVSFAGGGANFGSFWKVSGKSARWSATQRLEGSAFCDLRTSHH